MNVYYLILLGEIGMVIFYRIVAMLGGLAMFLYGMRIMGDGLKSSSGGAMKARPKEPVYAVIVVERPGIFKWK